MLTSIKENAMPRYQFLNIETFHLIIADAKEAAWQLGVHEGPVVEATRDVNFGSPSTILVQDRNLRGSAAFELRAPTNRAPWRQVCDRAVDWSGRILVTRLLVSCRSPF